MNLIIEQGNTSTKVAVFGKEGLAASWIFKEFGAESLFPILEKYRPERGIYSTVTEADDALIYFLKREMKPFILLDEQVPLPLAIAYETPHTLGRDRLAAVVGANYLRPHCDLLVIDAGTAITYELVEASGIYRGGNISPGMTTRFRALHQYTRRLPLVAETEAIPLIGTSTESAIRAGVVQGIVYEMDGYIEALKEKYPDLFVFLTGGHSFYFESRLKNSIFADINLVLIGLNRILEYNVEF